MRSETRTRPEKGLLTRASLFAFAAPAALLAATAPSYAQEVEQIPDAAEEAEQSNDTVVVTGSRLRRDAFSSPSPLTSLDAEANRQMGVTNINELIQRSPVTTGQQIDESLNTNAGNSNATEAPPSGGTGSSNISLRGLGPERTLVLLNGRRLASTGVRGAPSQPDIGLIPFSMVDRVEIVTEAGSSVYGADAVAGTVNVILRSDFEGFELSANMEKPEADGGSQWSVGFLTGAQGDRARITFGAEYYNRERVSGYQRPWGDTLQSIEVDQQGNIYQVDRNGFLDALVTDGPFNFLSCYQPGAPASGPLTPANFINCANVAVPDGLRNVGISNFGYSSLYNDNFERSRADLVQPLERISLLTSGEVDLDWFGTNNQFYFEAFYFNRRNFTIGAIEQIAPTVRGMIEERDADGNVVGMVDNPLNPFDIDVSPILTYEDLPQTFDTELQQMRFVAGMRGDIPGGWFEDNKWRWDAYFSYDRGTGFVAQPILFEPHLTQSLNYYQNASGDIVCDPIGGDQPNDLGQFTPEPCVVFDIFDPVNFFGGPNGDGVLPSDDLRAYLTGDRLNRTAIEQYVASMFIDGDLFTIPSGGAVSMGVGFEYRKDAIDSDASIVGVQGLNSAENPVPEGKTVGSRDFIEFFGEVNIPLVVGRPGIELLNIDGAVRYTDESNFGSDVTYRGRLQWKPVDWASLSGGYGTSFRAPNLRETFLAEQGGGVSAASDPCLNNNLQARIAAAPDGDANDLVQFLISQCSGDGLVYTDSDSNGFLDATVTGSGLGTTINTTTGGNMNLLPETSRTYTITGSMSQPWFENFGLDIAVSYYDIKLQNSVEEPTVATITNNCYLNVEFPGLSSPFCDLISRNLSAPEINRQITNIDATFFNIGEITARGIDINTRFNTDLPLKVDGEPVNWTLSTSTAYQLEQETQTFDPSDRDDNVGELGQPKFRFNAGSAFRWGAWTLQSEHRRIGFQMNDIIPGSPQDFNLSPFALLPDGTRPTTRQVNFAEPVWYHDAALTYTQDTYSLSIGVNNIADKEPPLVDSSVNPNRQNAVSSSGYDFFGRSYFITARITF